jgi:TP901 family phage tail tape measure protein
VAGERGRRISVRVESTGVNRVVSDLNRMNREGDKTVSVLKRIGQGFQSMGEWLYRYRYRIIAGVSATWGAMIYSYGNLEDRMAQVKVQTGATAAEIDRLKDSANAMGLETVARSATEAADAMVGLSSAGETTLEILGNTKPALDFAKVARTDVASAVDLATDALIVFNLEAERFGWATDVLSKGAQLAKVPVASLVDSLGYFSTLSSELGYTLPQSVAMLDALAKRGFRGPQAGTALRSGMLTFEEIAAGRGDKATEDSLKRLRINLKGVVKEIKTGRLDFVGFLGLLDQSGAKATDLATIFDRRTAQALLSLGDAAKEVYPEMATAADKAVGYNEKAATELESTLTEKMKSIKTSLQSLGNVLMESVAPSLKAFIDTKFRPFVQDLATIWGDESLSMADKWQKTMDTLAPMLEAALAKVSDVIRAVLPGLGVAIGDGLVALVPGLAKGVWSAIKKSAGGWGDLFRGAWGKIGATWEEWAAPERARNDRLAQGLPAEAAPPVLPSDFYVKAFPGLDAFAKGELAARSLSGPEIAARLDALVTSATQIETNTQPPAAVAEKGGFGAGLLSAVSALKEFAKDPLVTAITGPLKSTLLSAVTDPLSKSFEKALGPTSSKLGKLADAGLRSLDWPLSFLNRGLDTLISLFPGGAGYSAGRYTAPGTYGAPMPALASTGGGVYAPSAIHVGKIEISGVRDGEDAADKTVRAMADYEQISSRNTARQLQRGMLKTEAMERH